VTDDQNWRPPGEAPMPPPRYGEYANDGGFAAPPPPAWTPPPRPGLVPLRPLSFGTLMGAPFQVLRRNPKVTVGSALIIVGIPRIIGNLLFLGALAFLLARVATGTTNSQPALFSGAIAGAILFSLVTLAISVVSSAVLQGIIVSEVARGTLGERLTVRSLWRMSKSRVGALIGWSLLLTAALAVLFLVLGALVLLLSLIPGSGVVLAVLMGFFGLLGVAALAFWLNTKLSLVPSAIVLERLQIRKAVARSWSLTRGFFWRTLGVIVLIGAIVFAVSEIIAVPVTLIASLTTTLANPASLGSSSSDSTAQLLLGQLALQGITSIVTLLVTSILSVVQSSAVALIYLDLRMRKEGLDLKLVRFVEARQAGNGDVADPYLPADDAPAWPAGTYPGYPSA
jgi:membrane-anchored glycerophosphoryl diester phosphodiesterase (GDPDase)